MQEQVRLLLADPDVEGFLAAPLGPLAVLAGGAVSPPYPLPESDALRVQLQAAIGLARWVQGTKAELLHGHGLSRIPLYALAARRSRRPLVLTLHNVVPSRLRGWRRFAVAVAVRQCRQVIAVSQAVAHSAQDLVVKGHCTVVYNGIDLTRFNPTLSQAKARQQLGLASGIRLVLCVARLSPEKGVDILAAAATKLPGAKVVIAGDGPEDEALRRRGGIALLGRCDDIPLWLRAADLYCQPSREEGLGLAVIEAMAAGRAVVATHVGGLGELVRDSETGLLVAPEDPEALALAIRSLLDDTALRQRMETRARAEAEVRFSREVMWAATREVYRRALK